MQAAQRQVALFTWVDRKGGNKEHSRGLSFVAIFVALSKETGMKM